MKITSVRIFPVKNRKRLLALADVVFDGGFAVSDLQIIKCKENKLSVAYPISQFASGTDNRYICNPINREMQQYIERIVLMAYRNYIEEQNEQM